MHARIIVVIMSRLLTPKLIEHKNLLTEMVRTDFKLRYQDSVLGYLWSLLKPLMLFFIMYMVFVNFLRIGRGIPNFALSLLLGIVLWNFFIEATSGALKSIVGRGSLIRKISIPRYIIPVSSVVSAFINLLLNLLVVMIFVFFADNNALTLSSLYILPLLLVELTIFTAAVGIMLSALYVTFRDIQHIWDVVRQALFYVIPIIYPLSLIPYELVQKVMLLNPIAQIIQDTRAHTTYADSTQISDVFGSAAFIGIPLLITLVILYLSVRFFNKKSVYFAEEI